MHLRFHLQIHMPIKSLIVFSIWLFVSSSVLGQMEAIPAEYDNNVSLENLFDATLINESTQVTAHINFVLFSLQNDTLVVLRTLPITISKGISRINKDIIGIDSAKSRFKNSLYDDYFLNYSLIPNGKYIISWKLQADNDSTLAFFTKEYNSESVIPILKFNDSIEGELLGWQLDNKDLIANDSQLTASLTFYELRKGQLKKISPFNSNDSCFITPLFSPELYLQEKFNTEKNKVYYFKVNVYYKGVFINESNIKAVPLSLNFNQYPLEKNFLTSIHPDKEIIKEKNYWKNQYNIKPPKKQSPLQISGTLSSESGFSNIRYPFQITPQNYSRLIAAPTFTYLGIPITARAFLSTENSTQYPINSFSVGINVPQLKANYRKKLLQRKRLEDQLNTKMLDDFTSTDKYLETLEKQKKQYETDLKKLSSEKTKLKFNTNDSLTKYLDTSGIFNATSTSFSNDSLEKVHEKLVKQYNKTIYLYEKTKKRKERLLGYYESLKIPANGITNDSIAKLQKNQLDHIPKWEQLAMGVKKFDIGLVYPLFSELTLKGLPAKGVYTSFALPNYFFSFAAGKTLQLNAPSHINYNAPPEFKRNLLAAKAGIGNADSNHFFISTFRFKDPDVITRVDSNTLILPKENSLYSLGGKIYLLNNLSVEGELISSDYKETNQNSFNETGSSGFSSNSFLAQKAFSLKSEYAFSEKSSLILKHDIVGSGYVSLGVPFLRRDFRETEAKVKHHFFKERLLLSSSYKFNKDNLSNQKSYQNTLSGWGFTLRTKLKKLPNIIVTHTPFEMNSEFTPTQFSTQNILPNLVNRFKLTTVNVFYATKVKYSSIIINLGFLNNTIQNSSGQKFSQQSYTANINVSLPTGNTVTVMGGVYKTLPKVDSLNIRFIEGGTSFYLFKKISATAGISYHQNNPTMFRYGCFIQMGKTIKRFTLNARSIFNRLKGDWGFSSDYEIGGSLVVAYSF